MAAVQSLLHELLLALLGHTGSIIQPILTPNEEDADINDPSSSFTLTGFSLSTSLPPSSISTAERTSIDRLLECGFHYTKIVEFVVRIDVGAVLQERKGNDHNRRRIKQNNTTPFNPLQHPLLTSSSSSKQRKLSGLYLRALASGLDEFLQGYRTLILRIEQEILSEYAMLPPPPSSSQHHPQQQQQPRIEFSLTKLNLMLRQYAIILPALHAMCEKIHASYADGPSSPFTSPSTSTLHGSSLLSYIHSLSLTGVPLLSEVFRDLLKHLEGVLLQQCVSWMMWGRIESGEGSIGSGDGQGEAPQFFIVRRDDDMKQEKQMSHSPVPPSTSSSFNWDSSFHILPSLLPRAYFPRMSSVHELVFCGKAVRILREDGGKGDDNNTRPSRRNATSSSSSSSSSLTLACQPILQSFHELRHRVAKHGFMSSSSSSSATSSTTSSSINNLTSFHTLLSTLHSLLSSSLSSHLLLKHGLASHLTHLRNFVLMEDPVWTQAVLERMEGVFGGNIAGTIGGGAKPTTPLSLRLLNKELNNPTNGIVKLALKEAGVKEEGEGEFGNSTGRKKRSIFDEDYSTSEDDEMESQDANENDQEEDNNMQHELLSYPLKHLTFHIDSTLPINQSTNSTQPSQQQSSVINPWKQLTFLYPLTSPLTLIFTPDILLKYNTLFRWIFEVRRIQRLLKTMWIGMMKGVKKGWPRSSHIASASTTSSKPLCSPTQHLLLRHRMSCLIDTLCSYIHSDVSAVAWKRMMSIVDSDEIDGTSEKKTKDFDSIRKAHEDYLNQIMSQCFLRDRVVSGALSDLFSTCLSFCHSTSSSPHQQLPLSLYTRLSSEFDRQACFLFTVLQRKTEFGGGGSIVGTMGNSSTSTSSTSLSTLTLLHSLLTRFDYNLYYTQLSRNLGLNKASLAVIPIGASGGGRKGNGSGSSASAAGTQGLTTQAIMARLKDDGGSGHNATNNRGNSTSLVSSLNDGSSYQYAAPDRNGTRGGGSTTHHHSITHATPASTSVYSSNNAAYSGSVYPTPSSTTTGSSTASINSSTNPYATPAPSSYDSRVLYPTPSTFIPPPSSSSSRVPPSSTTSRDTFAGTNRPASAAWSSSTSQSQLPQPYRPYSAQEPKDYY